MRLFVADFEAEASEVFQEDVGLPSASYTADHTHAGLLLCELMIDSTCCIYLLPGLPYTCRAVVVNL